MASFTIANYGDNYVNVRVYPTSPYTAYRVLVRESASETAIVYDNWFSNITASFDAYVSGLSPNTSYLVNVSYNTTPSSVGATWIGAQGFTTSGSSSTTYYAYVTFNANGGSGAPSNVYGSSQYNYVVLQIPNAVPYRNGYTFIGWNRNASATYAEYYAGGSITLTDVSTTYPGPGFALYAIWQQTQSGGYGYISDGYSFQKYEVWIYTGTWQRYSPYVYSGGWKQSG